MRQTCRRSTTRVRKRLPQLLARASEAQAVHQEARESVHIIRPRCGRSCAKGAWKCRNPAGPHRAEVTCPSGAEVDQACAMASKVPCSLEVRLPKLAALTMCAPLEACPLGRIR